MRRTSFLLVMLLCLGSPGRGEAATLRVEKDGSGDFTVIQDAVDAAAAGDSILIGSGRFDTFERRAVVGGHVAAVIFVQQDDLTLIGAGTEQTILGPATYAGLVEEVGSFAVYVDFGFERLRAENLHMENGWSLLSLAEVATIQNCSFLHTGSGAGAGIRIRGVDGALIEDCEYESMSREDGGIVTFVGDENPNLTVRRCTFRNTYDGVPSTARGIGVEGADNLLVEDCEFYDFAVGIKAVDGVGVRLIGCKIYNPRARGILIEKRIDTPSSDAVIADCQVFAPSAASLEIDFMTNALIERCHFEGGSWASVYVVRPQNTIIRNSNIVPGSGPSLRVEVPGNEGSVVDVRENYWTSTDSTQVAEWVLDGDEGECPIRWWCPGEKAQFWPVLSEPAVPIQQTTFGGLKGRYRSPK